MASPKASKFGVLEFDMTVASSRPSSIRTRPWRKTAAEVASERAAARNILRSGRSADGGVDLCVLQFVLRLQEQASRLEPNAARSALQASLTVLRQTATNASSKEEIEAARAAVTAAATAAGIAPEAFADQPVEHTALAKKLLILHEVMPRLWVGGWQALDKDCAALRQKGVTHVVSVISADKRKLPPFIKGHYYARVDDRDDAGETLAAHFQSITDFIEVAREDGGAVFVHCGAGISRAPTVTAAYMVWKLHVPASTALNLIRRVRPCIRPNVGFAAQLKAWENQILCQQQEHAGCETRSLICEKDDSNETDVF
mmetsp:Transcript_23270/g.64992  ORF Transcript_23270/g.64992 Transcript_23270/m.64992 type:complete len:315 (-) Transcript_23270:49-993(-)